jgi:mRNA interferase RelE/StbE
MYQIRVLESGKADLAKLPKTVAKRIADRIQWLGKNITTIRAEPLKGDLSGLHKLRSGDYRIIYEVLHDEQLVLIHLIGHRKDIYKKRK